MEIVASRCHALKLKCTKFDFGWGSGWPPTLRPNQPIWAVSPPKDWLLPSADTIAIYYYYSARKLVLILLSHGGWKAESRHSRSQTYLYLSECLDHQTGSHICTHINNTLTTVIM